MKRILIILAAIVLLVLIVIPVGTRFLGPKMIFVPAPKGQAIGMFDLPRPETSVLAVDIVAPLSMLEQIANEKVPREMSGEGDEKFHERIKNGGYTWKATRGDILFENTGENLAFAAPFEGTATFQGELDAKILTVPLNGTAELGGSAGGTLSPRILPDWKIEPNLTPGLELSKATLTLGQLGRIDISELLGSTLSQYLQKEIRKLTPSLKRGINLRREINPLWQQAYLTEKISEDPAVWLRVDPAQVLLGPVDYTNPEQIGVSVAIQSETFLTNREPEAINPAPLPDLKPVDQPIETELMIPVIVSLTELNEVLARESFEIDTGIGTEIEVSSLQAEVGQNGLLNLQLDMEAEKNRIGRGVAGKIWVQGRPIIDYEEQTLGFTEVGLTVETKDTLTTAATWLLEGLLVKGIEKELRVDLDDYQEELNEEILKAIETAELPEGIDVSLKDLEIRLADIYTVTRQFEGGANDPGIVIVVRATGDVNTNINQLILKPSDEE